MAQLNESRHFNTRIALPTISPKGTTVPNQHTTPFLGILMLDTAFPRILGDAGNPDSYDLPARTRVIKNAGSLNIVKNGRPDEALVQQFCQAAQELETEGAIALVSTCGFLISVQNDIARSVSIPVTLSSLSLYPLLSNMMQNPPQIQTHSASWQPLVHHYAFPKRSDTTSFQPLAGDNLKWPAYRLVA